MWLSFLWCVMCLPLYWVFLALSVIATVAQDPTSTLRVSDTFLILAIEMLIKGFLIGPASSALYYAMVKVIRRERGYATKTFFHGFKVNFKTGAPTSLIFTAFYILIAFDMSYLNSVIGEGEGGFNTVLKYGLLILLGLSFLILVWIFPLLSRFNVGVKALFKNAALISIRHFLRTFALAGGIFVIFWLIYIFLAELGSFLMVFPFFLPALIALGGSFIIEPVLKKYTGETAEGEEGTVDEWYRE